ncbi:MAG: macro domain-containing protein [Saprospiraceae bacterium]|jgi:O-acetyl-ADP-ribose deacetylase (regulator of RNase III)|nr:macro domain-containing protein [Saprospiraceae bacterium]MBK9565471.1 macro domain-containing protein [Saprospiraceae bacterium]MBP6448125.1 macro domain-containing protein [Saprospiraceae bacterium]
MIKEVKGDILMSDSKTIAHCVAPMDHFDSGLALSLRENYPAMVKGFRAYCHTHHPKAGEIWVWGGVGGIRIINLMAQEPAPSENYKGHPGKASISSLEKTLKNLVKFIETEKPQNVAIPKLATGVGGLEWNEVRQSIYKYLDALDTPVFLYTTYNKGIKAQEG